MVLYPLNSGNAASNKSTPAAGDARSSLVSAWEAIERKQKEAATAWWLIAQPDHAALAGDLAASIQWPYFPMLGPDVIRAITLHDSGWAHLDGGSTRGTGGFAAPANLLPRLSEAGRPLSFLEMAPADFLRAWLDSIERAEEVAPIGGILVSEHFSRLAGNRLDAGADSREDAQKVRDFVDSEAQRRKRLAQKNGHSPSETSVLVDVLQFCDLLSLYLCCGSRDDVAFPQRFQGRIIRLQREGEMCRMQPSLFGEGVSLGVTAKRFPASSREPALTIVPLLLA